MTGYEPDQAFRTALTRLDLCQVDLLVTMDTAAAQWASDHGYLVVKGRREDDMIFRIHPGGQP